MTRWPCLFRRPFPRCFGSARLSLSRSVNVGNLNSKGIRQRDLVILFLHQDVRDFSSKPTASEGLNGLDLRQETENGPSQRL